MNVKFAKTREANFAALPDDIRCNVLDWHEYLKTLGFKDLPPEFDGLTITQISDIHSGSFDNAEKISYGIDLINAQQSDLILFTGDLVNNKADEMDPWIDHFARLEAPMGKFSILGNHDYGDYHQWSSDQAKAENLQKLKDTHGQMGWNGHGFSTSAFGWAIGSGNGC